MNQMIYIADDEQSIRDLLVSFLSREGYRVTAFENGDLLLEACEKELPDLVILDILMPGTDGLIVCTYLRRMSEQLPILIVSGKDSPYDRVTGLTLGADDYLVKPFLPMELGARVRALLRRTQKTAAPNKPLWELSFGPLALSVAERSATLNGEPLPLTPTEFDFLSYLMKHAGAAVSREELLKALWQVSWDSDTRATDDLVKRLRRKLRERGSSVRIETVWGYGFRLALQEDA